MSRPLFQNSVMRRANGEPYANATFKLQLMTALANVTGAGILRRPVWEMVTDADGAFPADMVIETPESGAWLWKLRWPDGQVAVAYVEQGDGSAIEIEDWLTLAGASSEAGTPALEWLLGVFAGLDEAEEGQVLTALDGTWRDLPGGGAGINDVAAAGLYGREIGEWTLLDAAAVGADAAGAAAAVQGNLNTHTGTATIHFTQEAISISPAQAGAAAAGDLIAHTGLTTAAHGGIVGSTDSRLTDNREWTGETVGEAEAQTGTATTRRAWTAQRVRQAIAAWWSTISLAIADISGLQSALDGKAALAGNTFTGNQSLGGNALLDYSVAEVTASISGTYDLDLSAGTLFILTVTGNVTVSFTNTPAAGRARSVTVYVIQGGAGEYSVTFAGAKWAGGVAPSLTLPTGEETHLTFVASNAAGIAGYVAAEDVS